MTPTLRAFLIGFGAASVVLALVLVLSDWTADEIVTVAPLAGLVVGAVVAIRSKLRDKTRAAGARLRGRRR